MQEEEEEEGDMAGKSSELCKLSGPRSPTRGMNMGAPWSGAGRAKALSRLRIPLPSEFRLMKTPSPAGKQCSSAKRIFRRGVFLFFTSSKATFTTKMTPKGPE